MEQYSAVIFLLAISIFLSVAASKIKIPYPIILLTAGVIVGFIPGFERITIMPEVVFLIFLPPLLYDAAFNISAKEFRANINTISLLAISLVFITTVGIAILAHYVIPGMTWPLSFVLGAILSPPDAIAAAGVTKGLGLSHKTSTILEGESLVNDASALIAYRFAVAAVAGASFVIWKAIILFFISLLGGCLIGVIMWFIFAVVLKKIRLDSTATVCLHLLLPFVAYLFAEEIHVSGVIAVVTIGLIISFHKNKIFSKETRKQSKSVWETIIFLLNGLVFILIGLEFPHVLRNIQPDSIWSLTIFAFLIFIVALLIRMFIIFMHKRQTEKRHAKIAKKYPDFFTNNQRFKDFRPLHWKESLIIGWSGMRGIVSLASALALPMTMVDGSAFPQRDIILFLTVDVVVFMLIIQGLGLPVLVKLLKIKE